MAGLKVLTYLTGYLDAGGRVGRKPLTGSDLQRFLPWTATAALLVPVTTARLTAARSSPRRRYELATPTAGMPAHRNSEQLLSSRS